MGMGNGNGEWEWEWESKDVFLQEAIRENPRCPLWHTTPYPPASPVWRSVSKYIIGYSNTIHEHAPSHPVKIFAEANISLIHRDNGVQVLVDSSNTMPQFSDEKSTHRIEWLEWLVWSLSGPTKPVLASYEGARLCHSHPLSPSPSCWQLMMIISDALGRRSVRFPTQCSLRYGREKGLLSSNCQK